MNCESDNIYSLKTLDQNLEMSYIIKGTANKIWNIHRRSLSGKYSIRCSVIFLQNWGWIKKSLDSEKILKKNFNMMW